MTMRTILWRAFFTSKPACSYFILALCFAFLPLPSVAEVNVFFGSSEFDRSNMILSNGIHGYYLAGSSDYQGKTRGWVASYEVSEPNVKLIPIKYPLTYSSSLILSITRLLDGDLIVVGSALPKYQDLLNENEQKEDGWVVRITPDMRVVWSTAFPSEYHERFYFVTVLGDGMLLVGGRSEERKSTGESNGVSYIFDPETGKSIYRKIWGKHIRRAGFYDGLSLPNGGYVLVGWATDLSTQNDDVWVLKVKANHTEEWTKIIGKSGDDLGYHAALDKDGNIIVFGWGTKQDSGYTSGLVIRLKRNGDEDKLAYFDIDKVGDDKFLFGTLTQNGGYIAVGEASTSTKEYRGRAWAVTMDHDLNKIDEKYLDVRGSRLLGLETQSNDKFIVTGYGIPINKKNIDAWITEVTLRNAKSE